MRYIKKIILFLFIRDFTLKFLLLLHNLSYKYASFVATKLNHGIHPKHRIMGYKEWFLSNIESDWIVLDVGCNTGMMPEIMSEKGKFIYGIELDCNHIKMAKQERQKNNIEYICADATIFDYSPLRPIDCVTLSNVLEHIEHRVDFLQKLLTQIKWNNKKRFLIRVPMIDREWLTVYKKELGVEYRLDMTHFTEYTYIQFKEELKEANIAIIDYSVRWGEIYAVCEG